MFFNTKKKKIKKHRAFRYWPFFHASTIVFRSGVFSRRPSTPSPFFNPRRNSWPIFALKQNRKKKKFENSESVERITREKKPHQNGWRILPHRERSDRRRGKTSVFEMFFRTPASRNFPPENRLGVGAGFLVGKNRFRTRERTQKKKN